MTRLAWVPELDTGIDEIDRQHRRILDYINQLDELRTTHDRKALGDVIEDLLDYTVSHFVFEETLLENAGYRFLVPHKKVHELFTRRMTEMKDRFKAGEDVVQELHGVVSRWLFNHIRNEDHGYVDAAKAYLRMVRGSEEARTLEERMRAQARHELEHKQGKKGWLDRLFGR